MSTIPSATPTVTVTIQVPPPSPTPSYGINTQVAMKGIVQWTPAMPGFVSAVRLQIVRALDGKLITPGGIAMLKDIAPDGFSWSRSFTADEEVVAGLLQAIAMDELFNEVARAELPVSVTPPVVSVTFDRPAPGSSFGIDDLIDIAGIVSWTPAKPGFVDSVRVSLLRKSTMGIIATGIATITEVGAGARNWEKTLVGDEGVPDALIRASALDAHGNELGFTDVDIDIATPTVTLKISSPAVSPVSAFEVSEPIPVSSSLTWTTSSPSFVKDVMLLLIRKADGVVVDSSHAIISPEAAGAASANGSVSTPDHLIDATIRVLAFDKFSNVVAQQEVDIRIP